MKQKPVNILVKGITDYIDELRPKLNSQLGSLDANARAQDLGPLDTAELPKRYTIYEPMLLLGQTFPCHTSAWAALYSSLSEADKQTLFATIVRTFRKAGHKITHIALNAPIQLRPNDANGDATENVMRSPINLQPLYGEFGPEKLLSSDSSQPTQVDFDAAFWVESSQLSGIKQVWAPRWTMFSRGNISEKARILGVTKQNQSPFPGLSADDLGHDISDAEVVDFYVGIGYFAFPYLRRNVRRVFGWEINGWSVEGLRRGCERNDIGCEVVRVQDCASKRELQNMARYAVGVIREKPDVRCVVFWGDNLFAAEVISEVGLALHHDAQSLSVRHCNLGQLPTSQDSWTGAVEVLDPQLGGWLHVHENAEIQEVDHRRVQVVAALAELARWKKGGSWQALCEHVEMVKTYAPGIGHFVFDIKIWPAR